MPHLDKARGTFVVDHFVRNVGRIKRATGSKDLAVVAAISAKIKELSNRRDLETLRSLREGSIHPLDLINGEVVQPPPTLVAPTWYVYVFQADPSGKVKVGVARSVENRRRDIANGGWETIRLICSRPSTYERELTLHSKLTPYRIRGEWYEPTPGLVEELGRFFRKAVVLDGVAV